MSERDIFIGALQTDDRAARQAFLEAACGADDALRRRVDGLLEVYGRAGSFLEEAAGPPSGTAAYAPAAGEAEAGPEAGPEAGVVIAGRYKLLEVIGEGGMGTVWLAEQTEPVRRKVAVKLIKPGMDSRQVLARFEAERQALALMDHPNIAKVHDGGATSDGRPFFVMELVKGVPITKYCDDHHLTPRQRLELFVAVCQAVQHAHQKGVIHRDLKPSNVLVAPYDGRPVVKVIDFGVAKVAGQPLTEKTLFTGLGAVVGTPEYMSPEQAELNNADVDTRSDVFSLGVLLYELLTGSTPLTHKRLKKAALLEVLRLVREEEPPKPSTRLSTAEGLPSIAARRGLEPRKLSGVVRGELDWIVMRALEKDRSRRYETANGFAADVQRYLADEPVQACPPSAAYRVRKFARRNKVTLLVASVVAVTIVAGAGVSAWQAVRATVAERLASDRLVTEREARGALDAARDERELQEKSVNRELGDALVDAARLREKVGRSGRGEAESWAALRATMQRAETLAQNPVADEALVRQVRAILAELGQVEAERRMVARLEDIYLNKVLTTSGETRRDYEAAFKEFGLPVFELSTAEAARRIAASPISDWLVAALDDCAGNSQPLFERLMPIAQRVHPDPWRRQYYEARARGDRHAILRLAKQPEALNQPPATLSMLAFWVSLVDQPAGTALLREAQRRHPTDLWINHQLAVYLTNTRPTAGAADPNQQVMRARIEAVGFGRVALAARPDSPALLNNLAFLLSYCGYDDDARELCRRSIALKVDNPAAHTLLGHTLSRGTNVGDGDAAVAAFREATRFAPGNARAHAHLANALAERGEWVGAIAAYKKVIALDFGGDNEAMSKEEMSRHHAGLGGALEVMKDLDGAAAALRKAIALDPSDPHPHVRLGGVLRVKGDRAGAIAAYRGAVLCDPKVDHAWECLGELLFAAGDYMGAVAAYQQQIEVGYSDDIQRALGAAQRAKGDLPAAARAYREAVRFDPERAVNHHEFAWACFAAGDRRGYRRACADVLLLLDDTTDPESAALVLRTCLPVPGSVSDVDLLLPLAEVAAKDKNHLRLLGAALYRAGKFEDAVKKLDDAAAIAPPGAWDLMFRVMAHHRLGQAAKARDAFDKAVSLIKTADHPWPESDEVNELRREAEALLKK